jgi:hypothetical protein
VRRREARHRLLNELLAPVILRVAIAELVRHRQIQRRPPHYGRAHRLLEKVHRRPPCHAHVLESVRGLAGKKALVDVSDGVDVGV